jgi:Zn-dependent protease with chaperone function
MVYMDFFAYQHAAQRNSMRLVLLFILALALIIVALNLIFFILWSPTTSADTLVGSVLITFLTLLIVAFGSLKRYFQLRAGGRKVAQMLGAVHISPKAHDLNYQRLRNVVEEMALASGLPVPALYVLEEETAINAMVAGLQPSDAAVIVTRGALDHLDREELQGVIAHEFSHIFHGDMRLNVRLIMILGGLLVLGQWGLSLLRHAPRARRAAGPMLAMGAGMAAAGYIGIFFGELIKAGISRQREFLADATAVQYTRNPDGLLGALRKIEQQGSQLQHPNALDVSHLCFGTGVNLGRWLATHPPLSERITRLHPRTFATIAPTVPPTTAPETLPDSDVATATPSTQASQFIRMSSSAILASIGNPTPSHLHYAEKLHDTLEPTLFNLSHSADDAHVLIYALLCGESQNTAWQTVLKQHGGEALLAQVKQTRSMLKQQDRRNYVPLLDLALPVLKMQEAPNRKQLLKTTRALIQSDAHLSVFEYLIWTVLSKHLGMRTQNKPIKYNKIKEIPNAAGLILSLLMEAGATADLAYAQALARLDLHTPRRHTNNINGEAVRDALQELAQLNPESKRDFLYACTECVLHDGMVTVHEGEILRLIAEALNSPMPPLLETVV